MKYSRRLLTGLVLAAFALPLSAQTKPAALLEYFENQNQIRITDADGFEVSDVYYGMDLGIGDRVVTANTTAEIRLTPNGSIIKLAKNTEFRLDSMQGVKGADINGFTLASGKLRAVASRTAGSKYEVRTPTAVCGVRGTDFGVGVIPGSMEAVAVRDGLVEFIKQTGQAVTLGAGQAADTFAAVFQPINLSPAQLAEAFRDMDFTKLDPAAVPREAPKPEPPKASETPVPPALPPEPPKEPAEKKPGAMDPVLNFLRDHIGMEVGSVTIDRETYSQVIVQPMFNIGKFRAAFYLPIIYTGDLFNSNDWYRPRGNNEWSFGTDQDWDHEPTEGVKDILRDLALKIRFIEYGNQRDPFFFKVGNLNGLTLGHGSLMRNYANDTDFPAVRRVGVNLGVDAGPVGFEAINNDLAEPEIYGARLYVRPFHPFRLGFGFSAAADIDPAGDMPEDFAALLPFDPRDIDPIFLNVAADIDLPLFEGDIASLVLFADAAGLLPYLRNDFTLSALETRGLVTKALFYEDDGTTKLRNYGLMAGLFGNIMILDYRLEYRQYHGIFRPGFYGPAYDRTRGQSAAALLDYLADPSNPEYDKLTMGIFGEAGFTLFEHLRFEAGYLWPFEIENGDISVSEEDYLELKLILGKGLIPVKPFDGFQLSLFYSRYKFVPTLLSGDDKDLELFDANTVVKGELIYPVASTIDLAFTVTTTVVRNSDGTIRYDSNGNPKWAPSIGIETRIHF
jgi:hypothetical protein